MTPLSHFVAITIRILSEDGLEDYLPTLLLLPQQTIKVLEDIPPNVDQRIAVQNWISRQTDLVEYIFSVRSDETTITAGSCDHGTCEFVNIVADGDTFRATPTPKPQWWTLTD